MEAATITSYNLQVEWRNLKEMGIGGRERSE